MNQFLIALVIATVSCHFLQNPIEDAHERPKSSQKSLLIAFGTTLKQKDEVEQVTKGMQDIVNTFASENSNLIYNHVLSLFNDPGENRL
jgi:hypothetical protein